MKLLVISNNPDRASFRQRIGIHLDTLRQRGVDCAVAKLPSRTLARHKLFRHAVHFDAVFLHKKRLNLFDAFWLRRYSKKVIYDFDDAVMYDDKRPERPSRNRQQSFQRTVEWADLVIAGNSYLARHARRFNLNVEILPTGLDTGSYNVRAGPTQDGTIRLVWIGSKSTLRYLAEIKPALEEIGSKLGNVVLRIICDDFFELANMQVEKRRWALGTQAIDLAASDIALAPLPDDNFTRGKCGFKVLQYAAAGLPVVASPVGVNAEYVNPGLTGFLATRTSEWVGCVVRLAANSDLRNRMGLAARQEVRTFDVSVVGKRLCDLIEKHCRQG
ncbi:MAG: glycosyltransferase family 4 protein [Planctomycetota bacterium]